MVRPDSCRASTCLKRFTRGQDTNEKHLVTFWSHGIVSSVNRDNQADSGPQGGVFSWSWVTFVISKAGIFKNVTFKIFPLFWRTIETFFSSALAASTTLPKTFNNTLNKHPLTFFGQKKESGFQGQKQRPPKFHIKFRNWNWSWALKLVWRPFFFQFVASLVQLGPYSVLEQKPS